MIERWAGAKKEYNINLVKNGIFPITKDINGNDISTSLDTMLHFPGTIQGEGKLVGYPSLIIRLSGCNLRCAWQLPDGNGSICDTAYSSFSPETNTMPSDDIIKIVKNNIGNNIRHVIITGGEPMLQYESLRYLVWMLKMNLGLHITLETNGTIFDKEVADFVDLVSISPKLRSSVPNIENLRNTGIEHSARVALRHDKYRYNPTVIQAWIDNTYILDEKYIDSPKKYIRKKDGKDFQLKFVIADSMDITEVEYEFIRRLNGYHNEDIMLMPLGLNQNELRQTTRLVIGECIKHGWIFTPRLHIDIFNDKRSV